MSKEGQTTSSDLPRLKSGYRRVRDFMLDGRWHTLAEVSAATDCPEASVSAHLRSMRKGDKRRRAKNDTDVTAYVVDREHLGEGLHRYRAYPPEKGVELPGPKTTPKRTTQRGFAIALAALSMDVLTGAEQRLLWCVDLRTLTGIVSDPTSPEGPDSEWNAVLQRCRKVLDDQPHDGQRCAFAMIVNSTLRSSGRDVQTSYAIPYSVDLTVFAGRQPPIGVWRIWPRPPYRERGAESPDQVADLFWYEDIPFALLLSCWGARLWEGIYGAVAYHSWV